MADGDIGSAARAIPDALERASSAGMMQLTLRCSLVGGYAEDDDRRRWSAVVHGGPGGNTVGVSKGHDLEDAILSALRNAGVIE